MVKQVSASIMSNYPSLCAILVFAFALPHALASEKPLPPSLASSASADLAAVVAQAPSLSAARARAEAARARLDSAARFPDPELEGMISRKNMPDDTMPMWELSLRQPLPKAGERAADRERAQALLAMAEAEFSLMAGEMAADIAMAIAEADAAQLRVKSLAAQITRTEQVLAAIDARIASGQGRLGDRLALQTGIAGMQLMVERERRMAEDALSEARGRLGLAPETVLPAFAAPSFVEINPDQAPALALAAAKNAEALAMRRMARASAKPMTAVGLRFEREQERMGNNDTIGVSFMTELPWRGRRYARAEERAAQAEASASLSDAKAARYRIVSALSRVERAERLAQVTRVLAQETQARLSADYETLVRSAGTSGMGSESSVLMILEVMEKTTDAQLQVIDAEASARLARAELWRYSQALSFPKHSN